MKLLIVDDEELTCTGVITSIDWKSFGIDEVFQADDGVNGLETARIHKPEIILCDVRMPRMDGITMLERVEKEAIHLFVQKQHSHRGESLQSLEKAKQLLKDGRFKISDISSRVGYSDRNYLGCHHSCHSDGVFLLWECVRNDSFLYYPPGAGCVCQDNSPYRRVSSAGDRCT